MISKKELLSRLVEVENHVLWLDGRIDKLEEKLKRVKKEKKDEIYRKAISLERNI